MLRIFKPILVLLAAASIQQASAFSLYGPLESWQTPELNYGRDEIPRSVGGWTGVDQGGAKNLGEEYRINTPILVYGFDSTFLTYFGQQGVDAVDRAMAILNALPAASSASPTLAEFPTDSVQLQNYRAAALGILDMKSMTLSTMLEHLGLMDDTHVFDLRSRDPIANVTCGFVYGVINRNFDPITFNPSYFVNGQLYGYSILDLCGNGRQVADAVETTADTTALDHSTVASWRNLRAGGYYNQISRDDMGGLRYLYRLKNFNTESLPPGAVIPSSPTTPSLPFITSPWMPVSSGTNGTNLIVVAATNSILSLTNALFGGVEKIYFIKKMNVPYLSDTFTPMVITNNQYIFISNSLVLVSVRRTLNRPDIMFSAADLYVAPIYNQWSRSVTFVNNGINGGPGPGNIMPQMNITFAKYGMVLFNSSPGFMESNDATLGLQWGSFDGTANDPVVFPDGNSIQAVEDAVLLGQQF